MYQHMNGWDWFWMVPMMLVWILVLGGVIYVAVRLALRDSQQPPAPPVRQ